MDGPFVFPVAQLAEAAQRRQQVAPGHDDAVPIRVEASARGEGDARRMSPVRPARRLRPWRSSGDTACSAFTPIGVPAISAASRMQPCTTIPLQPFRCASAARLPPTSAVRSDPPPSTTSTRPAPGASSAWRTSALSSKTRRVSIGPANARRAAPIPQQRLGDPDLGAELVAEIGGGERHQRGGRADGERGRCATRWRRMRSTSDRISARSASMRSSERSSSTTAPGRDCVGRHRPGSAPAASDRRLGPAWTRAP